METERAKMGPYMKVLQRVLGYRTLKDKFCRIGFREPVEEEDDEEGTTYRSPIIEKDEEIQDLIREREEL